MNELSINRQEIPIGSVVYFLTTNQQGRKTIKFGTVEEWVERLLEYTELSKEDIKAACEKR